MAPSKRVINFVDNAGFRYAKPPVFAQDIETMAQESEKMVVALIESRNRDVGVCFANRDYPTVITILQFVDHPTYMHSISLLMRLDPDAIIVSQNAIGSAFVDEIGLRFSSKIVTVDRKHFDETFGKEKIDRCMTKPSTALDPYFCATSSFAAVWRYFEWTIDCSLRQEFTEVILERPGNQLLLDPNVLTSLEILTTSRSTDSTPLQPSHSLASLFKPCNATGVRRLRQALQAPNSCIANLHSRLASVEKMVHESAALQALREELSTLGDMELAVKKATVVPRVPKIQAWAYAKLEAFFDVSQILRAAPKIKEHVEVLMQDDPDLVRIHTILNDDNISGMCEVIKRMVNLDYRPRNKSERQNIFYAIRPGRDKVLDVARELWTHTLGKVYQLHRDYVMEYPKLQIKLETNERHGYIFSHKAPPNNESKLSKDFIMVPVASGKKDVFYSTTPRLTDLNSKFKAAEKEFYARIMLCLEKTSDFLRARQKYLHTLIHTLTTLDFLSTLAHFSIQVNGVKPEFNENSPLIIIGAKHPIKSFFVPYVGCDFFFLGANSEREENVSNVRILTGYNGGGKTSRLQTLGLICILAHVGCFVPCTVCKLPPLKRIFARMGTHDCIETNASTFLMEMKEAYEVFRGEADSSSLVLIDELGRGTSHSEGAAFCWAMCEKLQEMNCMTLFATHFIELCNMRGAMIEYIATDGDHAYKSVLLNPESTKAELGAERYGIKKAKELQFPDEVIQMANKFSEEINTVFFRPSVSIGDAKMDPDEVQKMGQTLRAMFDNEDECVSELIQSFYYSNFTGQKVIPEAGPCPSPTLEVVLPVGSPQLVINADCSPLFDLAPDCIEYVPRVARACERSPDGRREYYCDAMDALEHYDGIQSPRADRTSAVLAASPVLEDNYFSEKVFFNRVDHHTPEDDSHVRQILQQELERHRNNNERLFAEEQAVNGAFGRGRRKRCEERAEASEREEEVRGQARALRHEPAQEAREPEQLEESAYEQTQESPPERTQESTQESTPEQTQETAPEQTQESAPEQTQETAPEQTQETAPEQTQESAQVQTVESAQGHTQESAQAHTQESAQEQRTPEGRRGPMFERVWDTEISYTTPEHRHMEREDSPSSFVGTVREDSAVQTQPSRDTSSLPPSPPASYSDTVQTQPSQDTSSLSPSGPPASYSDTVQTQPSRDTSSLSPSGPPAYENDPSGASVRGAWTSNSDASQTVSASETPWSQSSSEGALSPASSSPSTGYRETESVPKRRKVVYTTCEQLYDAWVRHNQRLLAGYISERAFGEWECRTWNQLNASEQERWGEVAEKKMDEIVNRFAENGGFDVRKAQQKLCAGLRKMRMETHEMDKENSAANPEQFG